MDNIYKKEYGQTFENEDENWRQKHDYKNLEDSEYQLNQSEQPYQSFSQCYMCQKMNLTV